MKDERSTIEKYGWDAAWKGVNSDDCPYIKHTSQWSWWHDGWTEAMMAKCRSEPRGMGAAFENE